MDSTPHEGTGKPASTSPAAITERAITNHGTEGNGTTSGNDFEESPAKRVKLDSSGQTSQQSPDDPPQRKKGVAPIKQEYLLFSRSQAGNKPTRPSVPDDDAAEAAHHEEGGGDQKRQRNKGQNTRRNFGRSQDDRQLCHSIMHNPEFTQGSCRFGEKCKYEHDLRKYLKEHKREDLTTLGGVCPVWDAFGKCSSGWKCRFVGSHMTEVEREDGRKELVLVEDESRSGQQPEKGIGADGVANAVSQAEKLNLQRKKYKTAKADQYVAWLDKAAKELDKAYREGRMSDNVKTTDGQPDTDTKEQTEENRALYSEPPFYPSEKRRLYFGPETPVLAPLTTQGNLPFRRLCTELGAQFTYSEMAVSLPLIQGQRSEWALMKAHESEIIPPTVNPEQSVVRDYDNSRDLRFGAQIAANKPWQAIKSTEILTALCPHLRVIDLNCGCPIDLVCREGAGSALLDNPSKLEKMLRGMNAVSKDVPITAKIRMGTKDNYPTALKLADRLLMGGGEAQRTGLGPPGIAALTLHGRSRQQRYTRSADWEYISQCSALIKRLNEQRDSVTDTVREPEERLQPPSGKVFFLGNGDCYSYESYYNSIRDAGVDTVMIARGALVKPWIFEEIQAGQYLDKSASERLGMIEKFVKYGLEAWGSDEQGVGTTRRFLLELLSFTHRYVPVGLLEYLPPNLQDRPPQYRGRNELETLLASDNYKDWIKISEMFLGPAHKDFKFEPKHKSNSYEIEAEG